MIITPSRVYPLGPSAAVVPVLFIAPRVLRRFPDRTRRYDAAPVLVTCGRSTEIAEAPNKAKKARQIVRSWGLCH